ncbi:hypothetical protein CAPTEDRAFT_200263 [Capitella teleta]|uniref:small monomeric GTPase n=1 Tax=Capitella teleta TaxID=283909 RepID=R7V3B5_CAPTE|nr:hypothetical protein CAPTEDRAFT_200263 [Capitella teleta]|eukprot:ELU10821.1 hypothetical protein CAPTEDRAFT_200263 [Capitella teleta]
MLSWIYSLLGSIWNVLSRKKKTTLLMLGLDNSGKSTLLCRLATGTMAQLAPSARPNSDSFEFENLTVTAYDIGARRVWSNYFSATDAVLFLVDGSDVTRFPEAAKELNGLLSAEELSGMPVAVLNNKVDVPGALGMLDFKEQMQIDRCCSGFRLVGRRPLEAFASSVKLGCGYQDAFRWIAANLRD